jgi:hypothetical protein
MVLLNRHGYSYKLIKLEKAMIRQFVDLLFHFESFLNLENLIFILTI